LHTNGKVQESIKWYERGIEQKDAQCMFMLGQIYMMGEGVEFNYKRAKSLLEQAAKNNVPEAKKQLRD
jgi:TPR repeat protein